MLHDKVIEQFGADIVTGVLPAGYRFATDEAAARFGVSRTVLREAVRMLQAMGLVTVRQHVGITVAAPDQWNPLDARVLRWRLSGPDAELHRTAVQEVRSTTEPAAAHLAARQSSPQDRQALTAAVVRMADAARAGDHPRFADQDAAFHQTLLRAGGNPMMAGLSPLVAVAITAPDPAGTSGACCRPADLLTHAAATAAIQSGDAEEAERLVRTLIVDSLLVGSRLVDSPVDTVTPAAAPTRPAGDRQAA